MVGTKAYLHHSAMLTSTIHRHSCSYRSIILMPLNLNYMQNYLRTKIITKVKKNYYVNVNCN